MNLHIRTRRIFDIPDVLTKRLLTLEGPFRQRTVSFWRFQTDTIRKQLIHWKEIWNTPSAEIVIDMNSE